MRPPSALRPLDEQLSSQLAQANITAAQYQELVSKIEKQSVLATRLHLLDLAGQHLQQARQQRVDLERCVGALRRQLSDQSEKSEERNRAAAILAEELREEVKGEKEWSEKKEREFEQERVKLRAALKNEQQEHLDHNRSKL